MRKFVFVRTVPYMSQLTGICICHCYLLIYLLHGAESFLRS